MYSRYAICKMHSIFVMQHVIYICLTYSYVYLQSYVYVFWGSAMDFYIPTSDQCKGGQRRDLLHPLLKVRPFEVLSFGERASQLLTKSAYHLSKWCRQEVSLFFHVKSWKISKAPQSTVCTYTSPVFLIKLYYFFSTHFILIVRCPF